MSKWIAACMLFLCMNVFSQNNTPDFSAYEKASAEYLCWNNQVNADDVTHSLLGIIHAKINYTNSNLFSLELVLEKHTAVSHHYLFQQKYESKDVYGAYIKVNLDKNYRIISVLNNLSNTDTWPSVYAKAIDENTEANKKLSSFPDSVFISLQDEVLLPTGNAFIPAIRKHIHTTGINQEWIYDKEHFYFTRDLNEYATDTATALVFNPDPITSADTVYGGHYIDANDSDIVELNNQRVLVNIPVNFDGTTYTLVNAYFMMQDWELPNIAVITSSTPDFSFTRSNDAFEDVNTYYHLVTVKNYIESLGYDLGNFQVKVDAHGNNGFDNSYFTGALGFPKISLGDGGVDDGEDADVVVHEYGHALSYDANNSNNGFERQALDEAFGDYLACSYGRDISEYRWYQVFTWDGHNEYWNGRNTNTDNRYPENLFGSSIHLSGQIYSGALMDVYDYLGKDITDRLAIQSLYSWASNMSMKDAGKILLQSDTLLYGGSHFCLLYNVLLNRGLLDTANVDCLDLNPSIPCDAGTDITICLGDTGLIGTEAVPGFIYTWSPDDNLDNPNLAQATVSTTVSTTYTLRVTDSLGTSYNIDEIKVDVSHCGKVPAIFNSNGFADGSAPLLLEIPENLLGGNVAVYDVSGRCVMQLNNNLQVQYIPAYEKWKHGMYFLYIVKDKDRYSFKLIRF